MGRSIGLRTDAAGRQSTKRSEKLENAKAGVNLDPIYSIRLNGMVINEG